MSDKITLSDVAPPHRPLVVAFCEEDQRPRSGVAAACKELGLDLVWWLNGMDAGGIREWGPDFVLLGVGAMGCEFLARYATPLIALIRRWAREAVISVVFINPPAKNRRVLSTGLSINLATGKVSVGGSAWVRTCVPAEFEPLHALAAEACNRIESHTIDASTASVERLRDGLPSSLRLVVTCCPGILPCESCGTSASLISVQEEPGLPVETCPICKTGEVFLGSTAVAAELLGDPRDASVRWRDGSPGTIGRRGNFYAVRYQSQGTHDEHAIAAALRLVLEET